MPFSNRYKNFLIAACIFSFAWIFIIALFSFLDFDLLLTFLEIIFSTDGQISSPEKALAKVMIAPFIGIFLLCLFSLMFTKFNPNFHHLKWHLALFITHLIFYVFYTKLILETDPVEGGLLEITTFILATSASLLFLISGLLKVRFALFMAFGWLFFAMEEISWGQSLFHFESPKFFIENNLQRETNIHNFFNPIFPLLYVITNLIIFSLLTWSRKIHFLSTYYNIKSVSIVLNVSDKWSLWFYPLILTFSVLYPGLEFVEEHWSIFGLVFSSLLLYEILFNKDKFSF